MSYRDVGSRRWGCLAVIGFFACLTVLPILFINPSPHYSVVPRPFSSAAWKEAAASASDGDSRCAMIADLQYRVGLVGKSRALIEAMLGPSEGERVEPELSHWHLCPSFMDIWILEVRWQGDRVADAWVRDT